MAAKRDAIAGFLQRGTWNSLKMIDAILESPLSRSEKLAAIAIASHRSGQNAFPSPGMRRLAALTSQKADTVAAAVDRLEQRGILSVQRRTRQTHVYDLRPMARGLLAALRNGTGADPKEGAGTVSPIGTVGVQPRSGELSRSGDGAVPIGDQNCPKRGYARDQEGTNGRDHLADGAEAPPRSGPQLVLTAPEPKQKQAARTVKAHRGKPRAERTAAQTDGFNQIRDAYFACVERKTKKKPTFDGRAGSSVWKLFDALKGDAGRACEIVRNAVLSEFGGSTSIHRIAADPNSFLELKTRNIGPKRAVQGGHFDDSRARDASWLGEGAK